MKIKIAVEARVSRDGKYCLISCPHYVWGWKGEYSYNYCDAFGLPLGDDSSASARPGVAGGRPLRCRECIAREVKP